MSPSESEQAGFNQPDFLQRFQNPNTKEGFWNLFALLWSQAQAQPGFNHQHWLDLKAYIHKLEENQK
jgi:hypothetical protein